MSEDLDEGFLGLFRLPVGVMLPVGVALPVGVVLPLLVPPPGLGIREPAVEERPGVCVGWVMVRVCVWCVW